eukprot:Rmarinus@m.14933
MECKNNTFRLACSKVVRDFFVLRLAAEQLGYRFQKGFDTDSDVYWTREEPQQKLQSLRGLQRICQYPHMNFFCRKVQLAKLLESSSQVAGIQPAYWILPKDTKAVRHTLEHGGCIVVKPDFGSEGKRIVVVNSVKSFEEYMSTNRAKQCIVQEYVDPPMLLKGFKFDFRVYVLVTSLDPLRVYVCREGITRFCAMKYKTEFGDKFEPRRHLTNYTLNRDDPNFDINRCKKTITATLGQLVTSEKIASPEAFWRQVDRIALETCAKIAPALKRKMAKRKLPHENAFQVLGFDILLDAGGRCVLLEVNSKPRLGIDKIVSEKDLTESDKWLILRTKDHQKVCQCTQAKGPHCHILSTVDRDVKRPVVAGALAIVRRDAEVAAGVKRPLSKLEERLISKYVQLKAPTRAKNKTKSTPPSPAPLRMKGTSMTSAAEKLLKQAEEGLEPVAFASGAFEGMKLIRALVKMSDLSDGRVVCALRQCNAFGSRGVEATVHLGSDPLRSATAPREFRVSSETKVGSLAGAVAGHMRDHMTSPLALCCVGPFSLNMAVLGLCVARNFLARSNSHVLIQVDRVTRDGLRVMRLHVWVAVATEGDDEWVHL